MKGIQGTSNKTYRQLMGNGLRYEIPKFQPPPIEAFATLFTISKPPDHIEAPQNETIIEESNVISKDVIDKELEKEIEELKIEEDKKKSIENEKNEKE